MFSHRDMGYATFLNSSKYPHFSSRYRHDNQEGCMPLFTLFYKEPCLFIAPLFTAIPGLLPIKAHFDNLLIRASAIEEINSILQIKSLNPAYIRIVP